MGEGVPAAEGTEISSILKNYLEFEECKIQVGAQIDPDATIFELVIDDVEYLLLEEDYVSNVEGVLSRFAEYGFRKPTLQPLITPPPAFNYQPYLQDKPSYFTKEGDDYNRLRLYETEYLPRKLKYALRYFLAKEGTV